MLTHGSLSHHLFAYGSLVDPACLEEVLGHPHTGERLAARLGGYQRIVPMTYPYPFIVPDAGSSVDGVLVTDLSPYDLHALDRYEEVEMGVYARELVEVEAFGCGPQALRLHAVTYVAGPELIASTTA
jgi:gamma-glutamylcyclotransferase (GGCT)/AIG2-like uncharacterized protein YtfP